jgi:hypothetical protein
MELAFHALFHASCFVFFISSQYHIFSEVFHSPAIVNPSLIMAQSIASEEHPPSAIQLQEPQPNITVISPLKMEERPHILSAVAEDAPKVRSPARLIAILVALYVSCPK